MFQKAIDAHTGRRYSGGFSICSQMIVQFVLQEPPNSSYPETF